MKTIRHLGLIAFFTGLISLEVWHGLSRIGALTREQRDTALAEIRRGQVELTRDLAEKLRAEREHARYLMKMPAVRSLLGSLPDSAAEEAFRQRLEEDLIPYLFSFPIMDRLALFDRDGRERFRLVRLVGGVGSIPRSLLGRSGGLGGKSMAGSGAGAGAGAAALGPPAPGEVALSGLEIDRERVEVPASDRQILQYIARVAGDRESEGTIVLTLYAAPLLESVRRWQPKPGVLPALIDEEGRYLAHPDRAREQAGAPSLAAVHPDVSTRILAGEPEVVGGDAVFLASPVLGGLPGWRLVAEVPEATLDAATVSIRGEYRWVIGSMAATTIILAVAGGFFLWLSIREVRLAESGRYVERLQRESDRYRAFIEGAADMIIIVSPDRGTVREANAQARATLGLALGSGDARAVEEVILPAHRESFRVRLGEAAAGAAADLGEIWIRGADGRELPASARLAGIDLGEERVVEVALRDLTRQKELERQLRISERLGSLGLLTAGVAHEINNPLAGIENYLALLDREGSDAARRSRYLDMIRYGFRRIRDIVRELSSFARPEGRGASADLSEVVERALAMVRYDASFRTVEVARNGLDRPLRVHGDPGRLEQVFINLFLNAGRAMKSRGTLKVAARPAGAEEAGGPAGAEPMVEVTVEDTGPGIPEEILGRIFDPFFTTGEGTGLGLSVSYGIVRALGGELRAGNRAQGGACFTLRLPAAADPAADPSATKTQAAPAS